MKLNDDKSEYLKKIIRRLKDTNTHFVKQNTILCFTRHLLKTNFLTIVSRRKSSSCSVKIFRWLGIGRTAST